MSIFHFKFPFKSRHTDTSNQSIPNYHQKAQRFIQSAHSQGRNVTAESGELIAGKRGTYKPPKATGYTKTIPTGKLNNGNNYYGGKWGY